MFFIESQVTSLPKGGIFVLLGIALLVGLYFILSAIRTKKKTPPCEIIEEEVTEKKESEDSFRPVVFIRTNKRGIKPEEAKKEEKNEQEEADT